MQKRAVLEYKVFELKKKHSLTIHILEHITDEKCEVAFFKDNCEHYLFLSYRYRPPIKG